MGTARIQQSDARVCDPDPAPLTVLVADDSRLQRRLLSAAMAKWNYDLLEAGSGREALEICRNRHVDLVLSDWVMPEMNGLEFCRAFRGLEREGYGYFILLTSKSDKTDIAEGLAAGADDFLTKPFNSTELRARLKSGERILAMESELVEKNRSVAEALRELRTIYEAIERDLDQARDLQLSLLPDANQTFDRCQISMRLDPSGHVGGDMVGYYYVGPRRVGIFALDVSGHGVSSAMMTARLTSWLGSADPATSMVMKRAPDGSFAPRPPAEIAGILNERMLDDLDTDLYVTALLADVDLQSGKVEFVQAGHPSPILIRPGPVTSFIGEGGLPVGMIPAATFETCCLLLEPGDRLLLYSDGFPEAESEKRGFLGDRKLAAMVAGCQAEGGPGFLSRLFRETREFCLPRDFGDDLSAVLLEYGRAK
ncbi:MAG: PP2C family protein-serine/threonine phosphatase [Paracoccaceae bacterium]